MNTEYGGLFDLTGRVAVITGGLGILGRHFCRALAEFGANVVIVDLDGEGTTTLARELTDATGNRCLGIGCDVADEDSVTAMVREAVDTFGHIDVLHNNAATKSADPGAFFAPAEDYDLGTWREVMAVNLDGLFLVARTVGRRMIDQGGGGSIIQTSSIYGLLGPDNRIYEGSQYMGYRINTPPVYAASKSGVVGLTRYLATQWAPHGIRVNTLVPGGVQSGQNETFVRNYSSRVPMQRMGKPGDLVGAVLYLASDASGYVTGQSIIVDGGWSAW